MTQMDGLEYGMHICSIFRYLTEQILLTGKFIKDGLKKNQCCVYSGDEQLRGKVREMLFEDQIEVEKLVLSGQLLFLDNKEIYLKDGVFDTEKVVKGFDELIDQAKREGFDGVRVSGQLPVVEGSVLNVRLVVGYEAIIDEYIRKNKLIALCHYDESLYDQETLYKLLRHHALVAIYGEIYKNKNPEKYDNYPDLLDSLLFDDGLVVV